MTEDEARKVELVRAIEAEDREGALFTREDRDQAEGHARAAAAGDGRRADEAFVARRAEFAAARLATRHPGIAALLERSRWPRWLGLALPLIALVAGFAANELGTDKRLELLAAPLLGTIGWNLLVYLWLLLAPLTGRRQAATDPVSRAVGWLAALWQRDFDRGTALHRAAGAFQQRWARLSARLSGARISRTLHLGAALFAAGLIGGIYLRALVVEYRAGWESTFLGPAAVHALLSAMLGPASGAAGVAIPSVEGIAAMRWTGPSGGGVNAGPWIHLYTVTLVGLIVAPRLLLAGWQGAKAMRFARRFPIPGREDFYVRRVLRAAGHRPGTARVTPYAVRPGEETRRRLAEALRAALGEGAQVRFDEPIDYGGEDAWLAAFAPDPADDYHVLLYSLSATPEAENHGALAAALADRLTREQPGTALAAVIDESAFRAHFTGQAGLDERIAGRLEAWRKVLAAAGVSPLALDLSQPLDEVLAQRIESGLLPDGGMRG